jgi:glycosyltransferase involved in cell wall biosynthesis
MPQPVVLLLCEYATLNGGERSMLATLDGVSRAGFRPIIAAPAQGPLADAARAMEIEIVAFEAHGPEGPRRPLAELRETLAERIRSVHPSLVHANSLAMGRLSGPVVDALGVPSISHLRDILRLSRQAVVDLNRHTRLLAVSQATREFHLAQGLSAEKTRVLYNGVDLGQFRPRPASGFLHRELGMPEGVPLLGTIGQISLRKGHDVLVRALLGPARTTEQGATGVSPVSPFAPRKGHSPAERKATLSDVRWLVVGQRFSEKDESREFEAELHRGGLGDLAGRLFFLGFRGDVDRILNELTLLVHPARQEPLGRVLLEAAAAGVPILATDVGGTREIFPPEQHAARLVPPDDPAALAGVMAELLGDAEARGQLATAARRRAEEAFDREKATEKLVEVYREVARES